MYCIAMDMGMREFAVKEAIRRLEGSGRTFTADDIARVMRCGVATVKRALPRLLESGEIQRTGSKRNGYSYRVVENDLRR
jgi:Fic family protein